MKKSIILFILFSQTLLMLGQKIKNLTPSYIHPLDFSKEAQAEWARRDTLLSQISSGKKSLEKLTNEEQVLIEKHSEIYENIWDIVGSGCSWYCGGGPEKVTASSYLKSQGENNYEPKNAHDLNYKNAWVEGVPGYGIGEYLTYYFLAESPRINEIIVVNGYVKSETAWQNNSRVKKLKVYINDIPYAILNLEDKIAEQIFKIEPIGNGNREDWDALQKKPNWTLKFEILDVYKGAKYDDAAISEIYFNGLDVHCFIKGSSVRMADGSIKNIEDLKIGDSIAQVDLKTKEISCAKVEKTAKAIHHSLVTYKFESGREITSTQDHPFIIVDKGWASLKPIQSRQYKGFDKILKISIGDYFITEYGRDKLVDIILLDGYEETYTISKLSVGDTFIVNGLVVGVEELIDQELTYSNLENPKD
jgi:hypothetical protein